MTWVGEMWEQEGMGVLSQSAPRLRFSPATASLLKAVLQRCCPVLELHHGQCFWAVWEAHSLKCGAGPDLQSDREPSRLLGGGVRGAKLLGKDLVAGGTVWGCEVEIQVQVGGTRGGSGPGERAPKGCSLGDLLGRWQKR